MCVELLPEPLRLELPLLARERIGKDFPDELELPDQLLRLRALGANRAEHQPAHDGPPHQQRHRDLRLDAMREIAPPIHGRLVRKLGSSCENADDVAALQSGRHPRELTDVHPFLDRP